MAVSLTGWLDPALKYFADQAGIPVDQYSSQVGGEGLGVSLEVVTDLFVKGFLAKAVQAATGLMATLYAIYSKENPRLKRELLALGTHNLLRFVEMIPYEMIEFRRSIEDFVAAMKRGDVEGMKAAVLRSPAEVQAALAAMGVPTPARVPAAPTPTPAPAPAPAPTPAPAVAVGKYQVTV